MGNASGREYAVCRNEIGNLRIYRVRNDRAIPAEWKAVDRLAGWEAARSKLSALKVERDQGYVAGAAIVEKAIRRPFGKKLKATPDDVEKLGLLGVLSRVFPLIPAEKSYLSWLDQGRPAL